MNGDDPRLGRLRWRARRGTRELDRLLGAWLDRHYAGADEARRAEFDALVTTKFEAVGLTYRKRLSSEERARANIERIAKEAGVFVSFDPPSPVAVEQAD